MNTRFTKSGYSISVKVALARPKGLTLTALKNTLVIRGQGHCLALYPLETAFGVKSLLLVAARLRSGRVAPTAGDACVVGIADSHRRRWPSGLSGVAAVAGRGMV